MMEENGEDVGDARNEYRLRSVHVENFKSYHNAVIGELDGVLGIMGPNGAGKSNFVDAIRFGCGDEVDSCDQIINRTKEATEATVTLIFLKPSSDGNSPASEEILSRTINANGHETLKINRKVVGKRKYLNKLEALDILGVKSSIKCWVTQGNVERYAETRGKHLAGVIEYMSGSRTYASEQDELVKKVEKLKQGMVQANSKYVKVKTAVRKSKASKKNNKSRADLEQNLENLKLSIGKLKAFIIDRELNELRTAFDKARNEFDEAIQQERLLVEELNNPIEDEEIKKAELQQHTRGSYVLEEEIVVKKSLLEASEKAVRSETERLQNCTDIMQKLKEKIDQLEIEKLNARNDLESGQKEMSEYNATRSTELPASQEEMIMTYWKLKLKAEAETEELQWQLQLEEMKLRELNAQHRGTYHASEMDNATIARLEEKVDSHMRRSQELMGSESELKEQLLQTEKELNRLKLLQEELKSYDEQIEHIRKGLHRRECSPLINVVPQLRAEFGEDAIIGRLKDLWKPAAEEYSIALHAVLWLYQDHIIVDTKDTAWSALLFILRKGLSYEHLIPLDSALAQHLDRSVETLYTGRLLQDMIETDSRADSLIRTMIGRTLAFDDIEKVKKYVEEAQKNARYNAVDIMSGTVYRYDGSISLYRIGENSFVKGKSNPKLAEILTELEKARKNVNLQYSKIASVTELELLRLEQNSSLKNLEMEKTINEEAIRTLRTQLVALRMERTICQETHTAQRQDLIQLRNKVQDLTSQLKSINNTHLIDFATKHDIRELETLFNDFNSRGADYDERVKLTERIKETQLRIANLNSQIAEDVKTYEHLRKTATIFEKNLAERQQQERSVRQELAILQEQYEGIKAAIQQLKKDLRIPEGDRNIFHDLRNEIKRKRIEKKNVQDRLEEKMQEKRDLIRSFWMDGVPLAQELSQLDSDSSSPDSIDADVEIDYSDLSTTFKEASSEFLRSNIITLEESIPGIVEQIGAHQITEDLPDNSIRLHQELELAKQHMKGISKSFAEAKARLAEVSNHRNALFMDCFEKVKQYTESVYSSFYSGQKATAILYLLDQEDPIGGGINYDCICPGKKLQNMTALSGGEKTLAGLSLLLGIFCYRQSPFLILDEVDAALDASKRKMLGSFLDNIRDKKAIHGLNCNFPSPCIIISHQKDVLEHTNSVIGITREFSQDLDTGYRSSVPYTLDLTTYVGSDGANVE